MKAKSILTIGLTSVCLSVQSQSTPTEIKKHFTAHLQGEDVLYVHHEKLSWDEVEESRSLVWKAWCEANEALEEDNRKYIERMNDK